MYPRLIPYKIPENILNLWSGKAPRLWLCVKTLKLGAPRSWSEKKICRSGVNVLGTPTKMDMLIYDVWNDCMIIWLYMLIYDDIWLYMMIYVYIWWYMIIYEDMIVSDDIWWHIIVYDYIWLYIMIYDYIL